MTVFTPHQDAALKAVADWLKAKPGQRGTPLVFRLFGYAGTGKTTLARHIAEGVDGKVLFAAFTGKAAHVMRSKGCDRASTIHSLIYKARDSGEGTAELRPVGRCTGVQSQADRHRRMLDGRSELGRDLMSFRRAADGAGRSGATAADPGRRLLHRRRARRHAHRGAPAGRGRSDRAAVDGRPRGATSWSPAAMARARWSNELSRSAARARSRSGSGRTQCDTTRLQRPHARAPWL